MRASAAKTVLAILIPTASYLSVAHAEEPPAAVASPVTPEAPASSDLANRVRELDDRTHVLEHRLELAEAAQRERARAATAPADEKGLAAKGTDVAFVGQIHGLVQADGRFFLDDNTLKTSDTFVVRRARPVVEASLFQVADLRLMPDFGNGTTALYDAYVELHPWAWLKLRAGEFKPPIGLERLQQDHNLVFIERALPSDLIPQRDVGAQLAGEVGGRFTYAIGVFNGNVDGALGDLDTNYAKDYAGRLFFTPFKTDGSVFLRGLGFGVGGSTGNHKGKLPVVTGSGATAKVTAASTPVLPSYKTIGQQTFFSYTVDDVNNNTVVASGRNTRVSPQLYYYLGGFGVLAEYVISRSAVRTGTTAVTLTHNSWQAVGTYLIGGDNGYDGVKVKRPFDVKTGGLGALEIAARYNELHIDSATFPTFANRATSASQASAAGVALNWHWNRNVRLALNYEQTWFTGGVKGGNRATEKLFLQQVQLFF